MSCGVVVVVVNMLDPQFGKPEPTLDYWLIALQGVQDIQFVPCLQARYWNWLSLQGKKMVEDETRANVQLSQGSSYQPQGPNKVLGQCQKRGQSVFLEYCLPQ